METPGSENQPITFPKFCWRVTATHTVAYFLSGIAAILTMGYEAQMSQGFLESFMRPMDSPWVPLGAGLQLVNGLLLSFFLYPIRNEILGSKTGWRKLSLLVIGFTLFAPQLPGPGSFEGFIYTQIPLSVHLLGLPELILYALLFPLGLKFWYQTNRRWMQIVAVVLVILVLIFSLLGYLDSIGALPER